MANNSAGSINIDLNLNNKNFNKQVQSSTNSATKAFKSSASSAESAFSSSLGKIGGIIASVFAVGQVVSFGKACVDAASQAQSAWTGLNSIVQGTGNDFKVAQSFLTKYTQDGLVAIEDAATAYKNLLARGYDTTQIENVMTALKDSAAFGRQSSYTLSQAVVSATEGLKNENSILVDNAGVTKNVAKMWEEYAASIGKTYNQLTTQEKIQAEVNGIMTETRFQMGDAATYTTTYAGKMQQLNGALSSMKTAIGKVIAPIVELFIPAITSAINAVTAFFNKIAQFLKIFGLEFPDVVQKASTATAGVARSIGNVGDSASETASNLARTGTAATKAAKQMNKAFSSVDEINVMRFSKDSSSGSSGSGAGGGSGGGAGAGGAVEDTGITGAMEAIDTGNGVIDQVVEKVNKLKNAFSEGFKLGWGDISFEEIIKDLQSIGDHIKGIFTDPQVLKAGETWAETILNAFGKIIGSAARIGTNFATLIVGSVESFFANNSDRIKSFIVNMFNISGKMAEIQGNMAVALANISDVFKSPTAQKIGGNIIAMFTNPFMSVTELAMKAGRDILDTLTKPFIENQNKIKTALENTFKPIEKITSTVTEAVTFIGDKLNQVYDEHIKPFFDSLRDGFSNTFGKLLDFYNEHIAPFLERVGEGFGDTWENHLKPMLDKLGELLGKVFDLIKLVWETVLKPLIDWIVENVLPVVVPILEKVWDTVKKVFDRIFDIFGGLFDALGGIIDFIVGVFSGDWEKAWNGIKKTFEGIWTAIKNFFGGIWDLLKGIVTTVIEAIKGIITTVFTAIKDIITNIWNGIKDFFTSSWNDIKTLASSVFENIKTTISNVFNNVKTTVENIWNGIKTTITNVINTIKTNITNVLNNIKTIWNNIWNGLKTTVTNIFEGIWNTIKKVINSILGGIEGMANGVVKGLNAVIRAMNRLSFDIPDWVPAYGGKKFGFNIKEISQVSLPRLAQGAYFEKNNPTLAVVGDNTTQGEYVTPEDKLKDSVKEAIKELGNNINNAVNTIDFTIRLVGDDGRTIIKKINDVTISDGRVSLII